MIILDLIKKSATMLNIKEILDDTSLDNTGSLQLDTIYKKNPTLKRMFEFATLTINEVCSYMPNEVEKICKSDNKQIPLKRLSDLIKIVSIKNKDGYVKYSIIDDNIVLENDGEYSVLYYKRPLTQDVLDVVETCGGKISEDVFLFGLNAYYCLANGLYAEYNVYNNQYIERLSRIKNLKLFSMPCRRWHE